MLLCVVSLKCPTELPMKIFEIERLIENYTKSGTHEYEQGEVEGQNKLLHFVHTLDKNQCQFKCTRSSMHQLTY